MTPRTFRERVLDALDAANPHHGAPELDPHWVVAADHHVHACPSCRRPRPHYLSIQFIADAAGDGVDFTCRVWRPSDPAADDRGYTTGCTPAMVAIALRDVVEPTVRSDEWRHAATEILRARRDQQISERLHQLLRQRDAA